MRLLPDSQLSHLWGTWRSSRAAQAVGIVFSLDVRSLALLRINLALLLIIDLICRSVDLEAHYTDFGVLPRDADVLDFSSRWKLSLHSLSSADLYQWMLFSIAGACAVALLVGYKTRLCTVLSWALLISLQNRNAFILDAGDVFFRLLLFWAMFLPLGASYSLDSLRSGVAVTQRNIISPGSVALILQICFVYWFTAILKSDPVWREEGSAIYYALNVDLFATPIGVWLRQFPELLTVLSFASFHLEAFGPCLLFLPIGNSFIRMLVIFSFIGLHVGIGLCLSLGIFPLVCITAWLASLPSWWWEKLHVSLDWPSGIRQRLQRLFFLLPGVRKAEEVAPRKSWVWAGLPVESAFCWFCLLYVFLWNLRSVDFATYSRIFPPQVNFFGALLQLDQQWNMFAPKPMTDDGWYVVPAYLQNGKEIDLWNERELVTWDKPPLVSVTYRNQRWRKYLANLRQKQHRAHLRYFASYLCRQWNTTHHDQQAVSTLAIYYVQERTLPEGRTAQPKLRLLWNQKCEP